MFALSSIKLNTNYIAADNNRIEVCISSNGVHADFALHVKNKISKRDAIIPLFDLNGADSRWTHIAFG